MRARGVLREGVADRIALTKIVTGTMSVQKNDIIDYYDSRKISCGLVLEVDDRRLRILNDQGKETHVSQNRALAVGKDPLFPVAGSRLQQIDRLKSISVVREEIKSRIDLQELWEVVGAETREIAIEDLSELFFGNNNDSHASASLLRAIFEDRMYFKIRPDSIEVISPERVEQMLAQRQKERQRLSFIAGSAEFLSRLKSGGSSVAESAPEGLIPLLEEAAEQCKEWYNVKTVKDIFTQAGLPPAWDPFRCLVTLGLWSEDENVRLRAERISLAFSEEVQALARKAQSKAIPESITDFTHLDPITIDAVTTRDVDDALSLNWEGTDAIVGIHIADAAHFVELDGELDRELRQRSTSIYLPDLMIPMMPPVLSEQAASLTVGAVRPALSVMVRFGPDAQRKDFSLVCSRIRVKERLCYEDVDARIGDPGSVQAQLYRIAFALRRSRVQAGALIFKDPELSIYVSEDRTIEVSRRDRESPSQILVSEMMILANSLFARFLNERNVPALFRSQPPPLEKVELAEEHDPVASYQAKKTLARGDFGTVCASHSTLGLAAYTTATSPLRRYPDLLVQRQLKAAITGVEPPLDRQAIERTLAEISYRLDRAAQMERERQRFFLLKYLEQRRHEELEAIVLQRFPRFHLVQLTAFGLNAALHTSGGLSLSPYDRAVVRIEKINPRDDKLSLSLVRLL